MLMSAGTDRVTTIFGAVAVVILVGLATIVFRRGSRGTGRLLIVGLLVVAAAASAYLYNLVPGLHVAPDERGRAVCDRGERLLNEGDSYYRWDILTHDWVCSDSWLAIPGIPGV